MRLKYDGFSGLKFAETYRAGGKWAKKYNLRKYLTIFIFKSNLFLLNVKILISYKKETGWLYKNTYYYMLLLMLPVCELWRCG